ncbi:hypothetical protein AVEN_82347-1 [Araneus ventricosus]|uniref:Tc1-like transposase DDE domain-containing protein n=1 Tax=Araneus ventricosus TaxID=182803 RepID=A0A4Y2IWL1_ARAVE|nr:hypothetical protein AVEN_82347-1 [Araneus ventricosus]
MFDNVGRPLSFKTPEKIEKTNQVFERSPRTSIRKAAQQTVNSARYVEALRNQFIKAIQSEPDFESMWFMQDGATPHPTTEVFDRLEKHFNELILALGYPKSKNMGIDWLPYSPDLNPCDSFWWGYIRDKVYDGNP